MTDAKRGGLGLCPSHFNCSLAEDLRDMVNDIRATASRAGISSFYSLGVFCAFRKLKTIENIYFGSMIIPNPWENVQLKWNFQWHFGWQNTQCRARDKTLSVAKAQFNSRAFFDVVKTLKFNPILSMASCAAIIIVVSAERVTIKFNLFLMHFHFFCIRCQTEIFRSVARNPCKSLRLHSLKFSSQLRKESTVCSWKTNVLTLLREFSTLERGNSGDTWTGIPTLFAVIINFTGTGRAFEATDKV